MMRRKRIYICDSCGTEYGDADYNGSGIRVVVQINGQYHDESIGQKDWTNDWTRKFQLCPKCWHKLHKFLNNELQINIQKSSWQ